MTGTDVQVLNRGSMCRCGCGQPTGLAPRNRREAGWVKGEPLAFLKGHHNRLAPKESFVRWRGGRNTTVEGYDRVQCPDHPRACPNGYVLEHVLIVEQALGHYLPAGAVVHHVNRIRNDNRNENLVACEDHSYHQLLHRRMRLQEKGLL